LLPTIFLISDPIIKTPSFYEFFFYISKLYNGIESVAILKRKPMLRPLYIIYAKRHSGESRSPEFPTKIGIQGTKWFPAFAVTMSGFRVKPGMTNKVKGRLTQYTRKKEAWSFREKLKTVLTTAHLSSK
jgi:hypothetical protein